MQASSATRHRTDIGSRLETLTMNYGNQRDFTSVRGEKNFDSGLMSDIAIFQQQTPVLNARGCEGTKVTKRR